MNIARHIIRYARMCVRYGDPGIPVPRDQFPASYYSMRRLNERAAKARDIDVITRASTEKKG